MSESKYEDIVDRIEQILREACGKSECYGITCQECPLDSENSHIAALMFASAIIYERRGNLFEEDA